MRKYKRQIARSFLHDAGIGNVNRKMRRERRGVKLWRFALSEHLKWCEGVNKENQRKAEKTKRIIRKAAQA